MRHGPVALQGRRARSCFGPPLFWFRALWVGGGGARVFGLDQPHGLAARLRHEPSF